MANEITFSYDALNRLTETIEDPNSTAVTLGQYDYNYAGLRISHLESERGNVTYFYDGNSVIEERNADDNTLLAHYRYADRLLSLDTGAGTQYYHHDALGSTVNLSDESGAVQVSYKLDPYGQIREQSGNTVNRQVYTGHAHDENTGLVYMKARYYDPDTGRFITQDAYLGESTRPPSLHRYLYAAGNPTVYVDPTGYDFVDTDKDNNVYWAAQKYENNVFKVDWILIGTLKEVDGKQKVHLTEEAGGGIVDYRRLEITAEGFWDRDALWSRERKDYLSTPTQSIYNLTDESQYHIINDYIDFKLDPYKHGWLSPPQKRSAINKYVYPFDELHRDLVFVYEGLMTPTDFMGTYTTDIIIGLLLERGAGQLVKNLKRPALKALKKVLPDDIYQEIVEKAFRKSTTMSSVSSGPKLRPVDDIINELFETNNFIRRVAGKHHLNPHALGNELPYGHKSLTQLGEVKHTVLQGALDSHLRSVTKTLPNGQVVDMLPRSGNPGNRVQRMFSLEERIQAVDDFYKNFADGRYYPAFRMELNAARKAGKLK